jgi:hypothetical protein
MRMGKLRPLEYYEPNHLVGDGEQPWGALRGRAGAPSALALSSSTIAAGAQAFLPRQMARAVLLALGRR